MRIGKHNTRWKKSSGFLVPRQTPREPRPHPEERKEPVYRVAVRTARLMMKFQGAQVVVEGAEHIPTSGGAIIALNHTGYLDFIFGGVPAYLRGRRLVRFMTKKEIFDAPFLVGWVMRAMKHVPVDRAAGATALEAAVKHCEAGHLVGIFPEGTISRSFNLKPFKTGAARIAHRTGVPLIPLVLWGSQRFWTKDIPSHLGREHLPLMIRVGEPVEVSDNAEETTSRLRARMTEMLDEVRADYADTFGPFEEGALWLPEQLGGLAPSDMRADLLDQAEKERRNARTLRRAKDAASRTSSPRGLRSAFRRLRPGEANPKKEK